MTSSSKLLKLAIPLVRTHGFSREALARSVLNLPGQAHSEPLSETAVSSLFGEGDSARRALVNAWLVEGVRHMISIEQQSARPTLRELLKARLEYNEPALGYLPEAFALLATPSSGFPPLDPLPAFQHATRIADEACVSTGDGSLHLSWYSKRAAIASIYTSAELHQITSPTTAYAFLDSLLEKSASVSSALDEVSLYSSYIFKSWGGIIKSSGIL